MEFRRISLVFSLAVLIASGVACGRVGFSGANGSIEETIYIRVSSAIASGRCAPVEVTNRTVDGIDISASDDRTIALTDDGGGNFFAEESCAEEITKIVLPAGSSTKIVYYRFALGPDSRVSTVQLYARVGEEETFATTEVRAPVHLLDVGGGHSCFGVEQEIYCGGYTTRGAVGGRRGYLRRLPRPRSW